MSLTVIVLGAIGVFVLVPIGIGKYLKWRFADPSGRDEEGAGEATVGGVSPRSGHQRTKAEVTN